jgi:hypothetical protein
MDSEMKCFKFSLYANPAHLNLKGTLLYAQLLAEEIPIRLMRE